MRPVPTRRAARVVLATVAVASAAGLVVPAAASAQVTHSRTLAPGVSLSHSTFTLKSGSRRLPESVWTVQVALGAHVSLDAASPGNGIGQRRITTLALGRQEHAVAGVNGDVYYLADPTSVPRGGFTHNGSIVKSALQGKDAVFYVTRDGRAHVGAPGFGGHITTNAKHVMNVHTVNSLENAGHGGLTVLDSRVQTRNVASGCLEATFTPTSTAGVSRVSGVHYVRRFNRLSGSTRAFMSCAGGDRAWMAKILRTGTTFTGWWGYQTKNIVTLMSAPYRLVHNGKLFHDQGGVYGAQGPHPYGALERPESFACVQHDSRHVILGAVEGRHTNAAGMTYPQLAKYLIGRGCAEAVTLDGSFDSTLVAKDTARHLAVVNRPSPRPVQNVNGLFVVTH